MYSVNENTFKQARAKLKVYELEFGEGFNPLKGDSKFFGMEIDDGVMVLQLWNNDFCTSSFVIPNAQIIGCNGKYTVASSESVDKVMRETADLSDIPPIDEPSSEEDEEDIMAIRMRTIQSAVTNDFNIQAPVKSAPEPRETIIEAAKEAVQVRLPEVGPYPKAVPTQPGPSSNGKPIVTRGKQKPEENESEVPQREIVKSTPKQPVQQTYKPAPQAPKPEPKPEKPSFGNW